MVHAWSSWVFGLIGAGTIAFGCGGHPEVIRGDGSGGSGGDGGGSGDGGDGGGFDFVDGGAGTSGTGGSSGGTCAIGTCSAGQRCEIADGGALCIDNTCADLNCDATQTCEAHQDGGFVCRNNSCSSDVGCAADEFCDNGACAPDVCAAGSASCNGNEVVLCSSNGGTQSSPFSCGSPSYFDTQCVDDGSGSAGCSCEGDWDCPANTTCEVDACVGTGVAPSCTLPPVPFQDVPPAVEIHWGGDDQANPTAHDGTAAQNPAPWGEYAHVVSTPIVANLDDDNGDGLINELDFPEILFMSHQLSDPWDQGVVRAIHGGGPDKGADYFAVCGDKLWQEGDAIPPGQTCDRASDPDGDSGAPVAVGDIDNDGVPEISYPTDNNTFRLLDNTGVQILESPSWSPGHDGETIAIANLDYAGFAEVIVGRNVYLFDHDSNGDLFITHILTGTASEGLNDFGPMACPADIIASSPGQEIVAGATLYRLPDTLPTCGSPPCTGALTVVWDATTVGGQSSDLSGEGYCAVADVWGADAGSDPGPSNPPDGNPEVILIDDGDLTILDGETGTIIDDRSLGGGSRGGAPNVDDFDGDGFMEIASALQDFYIVVDLQTPTGSGGACPAWTQVIDRIEQSDGSHNPNPARTPGGACTADGDCDADAVCNTGIGQCVCLHNGWFRDSDDDSSRATSSSVFDFNGDGAAEVLYNDECDFRVYDGINGNIFYTEISRSRTGIENPIVADVDNDGNAEVVSGMNTQQGGRCDDDTGDGVAPRGPNGIRVWGDPTDTWVSARRIWNQQSYHVVNVTEGGQIPEHPPESWGNFNGRTYNTYRSQPRNFGVAPDLTVVDVGVSSPDTACGTLSDTIDIAFEIRNDGDLRVGPGVVVGFEGDWGTDTQVLLDGAGSPIELTLTQSLEPGSSVILSVTFNQANNSQTTLPDTVRVIADRDAVERECNEGNNQAEQAVVSGADAADLRIELGAATNPCPNGEVVTTIFNDGTQVAANVVVRYFAGDPSQGGEVIHEEAVAGPIAPGSSETFTATLPNIPQNRDIIVFAIVDPDDAFEECSEANNRDSADDSIRCNRLLQ